MKAMNTLAPTKEKKLTFSASITGDAMQNLIRKSVAAPEAAARLTATLISAVAASPQLQQCNPASIVAAALRGEGMNLTYGIDYHLVPFGDKCTFITGYKGLLHLLIATGEVADANCIPVLEGEFIGRNKRTKRPEFDFSVYANEEDEAGHPVIGWYFYVDLRNGYTASEFMRESDVLLHAQRYSKSFDLETYQKLNRGEFSPQEAERIKEKSPWYGNFDAMARKTVIRKLLNSGFVPLANSAELRRALDSDNDSGEGAMLSADILNTMNGDVIVVNEETGEVVRGAESTPVAAEPQPESAPAENTEKPKRGRKPRLAEIPEDDNAQNDETLSSFFGDGE